METFTELNLNTSLMQSITRMHFKIPTPIQAQAIPPALLGKDILIQSYSAFLLSLSYLIVFAPLK